MEQLSRPYQIALGAILVFALAYFLVLKPGDDAPVTPAPAPAASAPANPTAPGVAGLGRAVDKANGAVAQSGAGAQATQDAAAAASGESPAGAPTAQGGGSSTPPGGSATPSGGGELEPGDASRSILDDVADRKVAVVLFYNRKGADDQAVRRALKRVDRFKGKVRVRQIPIERVADYPAITQGVPVTQAPTIVVLDEDKQARRLVGYQDTKSIQQLVGDVGERRLRDSDRERYRTRVFNICEEFDVDTDSFVRAYPDDPKRIFTDVRDEAKDMLRRARALDPPRGFSAFHSALIAELENGIDAAQAILSVERVGRRGVSALIRRLPEIDAASARFETLARAKRFRACL